MQETKYCVKCNQAKSVSDFCKCKSHQDGLHSWCKVCNAAYSFVYGIIHREEISAKRIIYDKIHKKRKAIYDATYCVAYYTANKIKITAYQAAYNKTPEGLASKKRRLSRRRKVLQSCIATLTALEWQNILVEWDYRCAYCGRNDCRLEQDHFIPLSKGGNHTVDNILPACRKCNAEKSNKIVERPNLAIVGTDSEKFCNNENRNRRLAGFEIVARNSLR